MKPSNTASLRDAIEKVIEILNRERDARRETSAMREMQEICTAALAAPPRNCDRYPTVAEARNAFICEQCEHPCGDCTVCDDDYALCRPCGIKWLFTPAKAGVTSESK